MEPLAFESLHQGDPQIDAELTSKAYREGKQRNDMRIIIMGTGPFAVPSAERILADGHDVPLVVTRPLPSPPPKKLPPRPVYDWAQSNDLPLFEPNTINEPAAIEELARQKADLFFVCDYGQILSNECLSQAKLGGINLHGSILPRHRGAAPVQWALLRGDKEAGVTVIHMTPRLDAGPALTVASTEIRPDEDAGELEPRLAEIGVACTADAIAMLTEWDGNATLGTIQDKSQVTRAPRFAKSDGALDFRLPAEYLVRLIRACQPWPGTFGELQWPDGNKKVRLIIRKARWIEAAESDLRSPGEATAISCKDIGRDWQTPWDELIAIRCGSGLLLASRVQPAGKREMDAREFLRGHPIAAGAKFLLPESEKSPLDA